LLSGVLHVTINCQFRLGHSRKGYVNGDLFTEYLKIFDDLTKKKAKGRYRVLLLDGHGSHFHLKCLKYARANRIIVLCYPSHTTHILQGLDVVVFSPLKRAWESARNDYEMSTGRAVTKSTFLDVFSKAWLHAMRDALIKTAFAKTSVFPFREDIISAAKLSPSIATTVNPDAVMPFSPPTPVKVMRRAMLQLRSGGSAGQTGEAEIVHDIDELMANSTLDTSALLAASRVSQSLLGTSCAPLVLPSSFDSSFVLPSISLNPPQTPRRPRFCHWPSSTEVNEPGLDVHAQLAAAQARTDALENRVLALESESSIMRSSVRTIHAEMVLQGMYCEQTRLKLHGKEEKEREKAAGTTRLTNTQAALLTDDGWLAALTEQDEARQAKETTAVVWKDLIAKYRAKKAAWDEAERRRKARNTTIRTKHKVTIKAWKGKGAKPTQKGLRLKPETPKPIHPFPRVRKVVTAVPEPVEDDEEMTDNEEDEDGSDSGGERSD
jgi:hypothetical protein